MNFDLNENKEVVVLLGAGNMGLAIIKRIVNLMKSTIMMQVKSF
nr:hypothetical protein [Methanobrevibacter sp.]